MFQRLPRLPGSSEGPSVRCFAVRGFIEPLRHATLYYGSRNISGSLTTSDTEELRDGAGNRMVYRPLLYEVTGATVKESLGDVGARRKNMKECRKASGGNDVPNVSSRKQHLTGQRNTAAERAASTSHRGMRWRTFARTTADTNVKQLQFWGHRS